MNTTLLPVLTILCALCASALAATGLTAPAFAAVFTASALLACTMRAATGHWVSLALLFVLFASVYALSGPLHVLMGERLAPVFTFPYKTDAWLEHQGYAVSALALAALCVPRVVIVPRAAQPATDRSSGDSAWYVTAIACLAIASLSEITTFVQVGGLGTVALGKGAYQSRATDLPLTLPSMEFATLGVAMLALWASTPNTVSRGGLGGQRARLAAAGMLMLPVVSITLALGRRGPLFGWILSWLMARTLSAPVTRLPVRWVGGGLLLLVVSGVLFAGRASLAFGAATGDWEPFRDAVTNTRRLVTSLNPAESEFGAPFGNFSEFLQREEPARRWGESYLHGLATLIPGALYPGEKPEQITYRFRDRYFPSEGQRGGVASTGFSSVLEARLNFGAPGVVLVYFVTGAVLLTMERFRTAGLGLQLLYVQLVPMTQAFHRSALSLVVGTAVLSMALIFSVRFAMSLVALLRAGADARTYAAPAGAGEAAHA